MRCAFSLWAGRIVLEEYVLVPFVVGNRCLPCICILERTTIPSKAVSYHERLARVDRIRISASSIPLGEFRSFCRDRVVSSLTGRLGQ